VYKEDLQEFSRTIVSDTSAVIKDKVEQFNTDPKATTSASHTHLQARVLRIQRDPKTHPFPFPHATQSYMLRFTLMNQDITKHLLTLPMKHGRLVSMWGLLKTLRQSLNYSQTMKLSANSTLLLFLQRCACVHVHVRTFIT